MECFEIKSESDFLEAATRALSGELDFSTGVKFIGWPSMNFKIDGERYKQTLPTNAMFGLVLLQESYNRVFAITKYDTTNLQRLTEREKNDLEFVFKISAGSTDNQANTDTWLNSFIENIGNVMTNMDSKHKAAVMITAVLAAGGYFIGSEILEASSKNHQATSNVALVEEVNKGHIQTIEKLLLLTGPKVDDIKGVINEGQIGLIKNVSDADSVEFNSFKVDKTTIQKIAKTQKVAKDKVEKELKLTIDGFKRGTEYLLFTVTDTVKGNSFSLKVDLGFTTQEELDLIFAAMKDATEINLSVDLVVKSGTIERGRLIKVISKP